jgi:trans-2,3-dihydro-3-hydroxyanthranilate isomerase
VTYRYYLCDVFTERRFGGNQLAVLPNAEGLSGDEMQQIAREFNFSESAFVFPPNDGHTRAVRIFTPAEEVPFAGHPNVGTAFVLAVTRALGEIRSSLSVTFEEKAGPVQVTIQESGGKIIGCEVAAPQTLSLGKTVAPDLISSAVSLSPEDILTKTHLPQVASAGLAFVITELKDRDALERARINMNGFQTLLSGGTMPLLYLYTRASDGFDLRARMFAPLSGVPEDPATGSASCVVAGVLAHYNQKNDGHFSYRIAQGVEMGRPSVLVARARKAAGVVQATSVGGAAVLVSEGSIYLD